MDAGAKKVGVLGRGSGGTFTWWQEAFPRTFAAQGFVKGRNLDLRFYGVEMPPEKAEHATLDQWLPIWRAVVAKMISDQLDCIVTNGEPATRYLLEQTRTIPIVTIVSDPVGFGVAKSLARPGRNVTGLHSGESDIAFKTVELFRRLIPGLKGIGWVGWQPFFAGSKALETVTRSLGLDFRAVMVESMDARGAEKARAEVAQFRAQGILGAMVVVPDDDHMQALFRQALESRIALTGGNPNQDGHLFSYGAHWPKGQDPDDRVAAIAARILRGEKPGDIPFEGPNEYFLAVNLRTAGVLGITIPPDVQLLATKLIK